MSRITFYRQARQDGGFRTGVEVDDVTVLEQFDPGSTYDDPALLWYVDVRCQGKSLPQAAEAARKWLVGIGPAVRQALEALAEEVSVGIDMDMWPLLRRVADGRRGAKIEIACSAIRRVDGRQIAQRLREIASAWERRLKELPSAAIMHEKTGT